MEFLLLTGTVKSITVMLSLKASALKTVSLKQRVKNISRVITGHFGGISSGRNGGGLVSIVLAASQTPNESTEAVVELGSFALLVHSWS
jgi:hypothetical protein